MNEMIQEQKDWWALQRLDLFSQVEPEAFKLHGVHISQIGARESKLLRSQTDHVFGVMQGSLKLYRSTASGEVLLIKLVEQGDVFGYLMPGEEEDAFMVQTMEETKLVSIPRDVFWRVVHAHPTLAYEVIQRTEEENRCLMRRVEALIFKDVHTRVSETLLELARNNGDPCQHGMAVDVRLTQQDLADLVGASRQMVSRVLGELTVRDCIHRVGRVICIQSLERLEEYATQEAKRFS